jgi:predicted transglutaminase-like cysteine proteinase
MSRKLLLAAAMVLAGIATASAEPSRWMTTGDLTSQPIGHYELCQRSPVECSETTPNAQAYPLTRPVWKLIVDVNNVVNTTIKPMTDMQQYGVEDYWTYPDSGYGDCEDYAMLKRRKLMEKGIPAGDLLMTVVRQSDGDGHAVLTVHTDHGDFILDNLDPRVRLWSQTDYRYLKRQSETSSGAWVSIEDGEPALVGSIRQ